MSKRFRWVCYAIAGLLGCAVVASMHLPLIGYLPPGLLATWGIGALVVTAGEQNP